MSDTNKTLHEAVNAHIAAEHTTLTELSDYIDILGDEKLDALFATFMQASVHTSRATLTHLQNVGARKKT